MPMNEILRTKRKEQGLTQEQIAERLGVSTPAVNKWEKGATYPDVTLLPPLARLLKVDLNTLLCFNEGLTHQEIAEILNQAGKMLNKGQYSRGFESVMEKVRAYPNSWQLLHSGALLLDGGLMMSGMPSAEREGFEAQILALYERVAESGDSELRGRAATMLASKYMERKEYEKAQEMLDRIPGQTQPDKRQLQAQLLTRQGKLEEAAVLLERKLLGETTRDVQLILYQLAGIAQKEGDEQRAEQIAQISGQVVELLEMWSYEPAAALLELALKRRDTDQSLAMLEKVLNSMCRPRTLKNERLYRHILAGKTDEDAAGVMRRMLPGLLAELEQGEEYAFLKGDERFCRLLERYRAECPAPEKE